MISLSVNDVLPIILRSGYKYVGNHVGELYRRRQDTLDVQGYAWTDDRHASPSIGSDKLTKCARSDLR